MKFSISQSKLAKPLQDLYAITDKKKNMAILANFLFRIKDSSIEITASDLEMEMSITIDDVINIDGDNGDITIPAKTLTDIVKTIPENEVITIQIDTAKSKANISSGKSHFKLLTLAAIDYPVSEDKVLLHNIEINTVIFKNLLDKTSFCIAIQDVRYYLNGLLLEFTNSGLNSVATDGHRLAKYNSLIDNLSLTDDLQIILPRRAVSEIVRLFSDTNIDSAVKIYHGFFEVNIGNYRFITKLIDGKYPDYQRVIPIIDDSDYIVLINRIFLKNSLTRISVLSHEKFRGVRFLIEDNKLNISIHNQDHEQANDEIAVDYNDIQIDIGFNVNYLIDALNALTTDVVQFRFTDNISSCIVMNYEADGPTYVVMPMKI